MRSLASALILLVSAPWAASAGTAGGAGRVLIALDEALALCFPGCRIERGTEYLTPAQMAEAERLAGQTLEGSIVHPYVALRDGELVGTAYVDTHRVRTLRESVLVVVGPTERVERVEVLAFAEPAEYLPRGSWYAQFHDKRLDGELHLSRGIRGITGATLTARATTDAVRRVLATHRVLAREAEPAPPRPAPPQPAPQPEARPAGSAQ